MKARDIIRIKHFKARDTIKIKHLKARDIIRIKHLKASDIIRIKHLKDRDIIRIKHFKARDTIKINYLIATKMTLYSRSLMTWRFQVYNSVSSITNFKWRVTWYYKYSPFNTSQLECNPPPLSWFYISLEWSKVKTNEDCNNWVGQSTNGLGWISLVTENKLFGSNIYPSQLSLYN